MGVAPPQALVKRGNEIVVFLPGLVIGEGFFREGLLHNSAGPGDPSCSFSADMIGGGFPGPSARPARPPKEMINQGLDPPVFHLQLQVCGRVAVPQRPLENRAGHIFPSQRCDVEEDSGPREGGRDDLEGRVLRWSRR